jgi:hypothetical protein
LGWVLFVFFAPGPLASPTAEQLVEIVVELGKAAGKGILLRRTGSLRLTGLPGPPPGRVGKHGVGLVHLLEALLG